MNWLPFIEKMMGRFSLVGDRAIFDAQDFPWARQVEYWHPEIIMELNAVLSQKAIPNFQDISVDQACLTQDDCWKTFFFYAYGERSDENCEACPHTDEALRRIPGMRTAFFSIMEPGKVIPEHRGPYKGVLRYHLGLVVPEIGAGIRINGKFRSWESGRSLIFDDTYPHDAWNVSNKRRVVLFVDFLRPLPFPLNLLNRAIVRYIRSTEFVQGGVRRVKEWSQK